MKNLARYITTMLLVLAGALTAAAQNDPFLPGDPGHAAPHHKLKIVSTEANNIIIEVYTHSANGNFDMMYDDVNHEFWFIEANNLPGMTNTSLLPEAAKADGTSYEDLVESLVMNCGR